MIGAMQVRIFCFFCLPLIFMIAMPSYVPAASPGDASLRLAPWYGGRDAAVSLRFDDNQESHLDKAIPIMNRFNVKGTFMVSPGRSSFKKRQDTWFTQVPSMGHDLGNHTMNHRGAAKLDQAMYEISEAAKIIRANTGDPHRLLVFASGGGKRWGGNRWSSAEEAYLRIPGSLDMIDLYDGNHPYVNVTANITPDELIGYVDAAAEKGLYQAFTFHNIGAPTFRDIVRRVVRGKNLSYPEENFSDFIKMLSERSERVWIATLVDILKYQAQYQSARLERLEDKGDTIRYQLSIATEPSLYDHPLTLVLREPEEGKDKIRVFQDERPLTVQAGEAGTLLADLSPKNSLIQIKGSGTADPGTVK